MENEKKKSIILMLVAIITLLTLIIGATYAYFQASGNSGSGTDVNVVTATSDLLTFKIDKDINIIVSQSDFKKGAGNKSDSTKASAILTASNSKNIESSSDRYNIYFIIEANDFIYTTNNATAEILLNVTDPNGNKVENITGLVHTDKGFDITTRTGGFLLVPDYDITATRGNTTTQEWKVEVTLVNLDTDQNKNTGKTLSGKLYVTKEKMSSYELTKITNVETETTYNSIKTTLQVASGTSPIEKYYYGIEKISSDATGYANNNSLKRLAFNDVSLIESDKPTYTFKNLEDNATYKIYSYGIDKNKIKTNMYETEITTNSYNVAKINSVSHTSTLNSITLNVNAQKGDNEIEKYFYSKDNGETYIESTSSTYTFDNLTDTTEYKIKVKVLDSYGRYSTEYLEAIATTTYILPSVTKVNPTTKYNQITVTTTGTKGTNEISKYYYSINNSSYVEGTSTYTFTNLTSNTTFYIKVYVKDSNGKSSSVFTTNNTTILTIADYVISQYTGTQGSNGIYYHNSSLANGAEDNSYRYAGANPNNFVCFGSDVSPCPTDNLYRIIGVINGKVKLIKYDYANNNLLGTDGDYYGSDIPDASYYKGSLTTINTYYWNNATKTNTWSESNLNKVNLNTNYINNIGITWANKIATTTWKVGNGSIDKISFSVPKTAYQNEVGSSASTITYDAKIGLMYASDYYYAAGPSAWTLVGYNYNDATNDYRAATSINWIHMGMHEWIISRDSYYSDKAYYASKPGFVTSYYVIGSEYYNLFGARPSFNLLSSITYVSGDGTKSNPIRLS